MSTFNYGTNTLSAGEITAANTLRMAKISTRAGVVGNVLNFVPLGVAIYNEKGVGTNSKIAAVSALGSLAGTYAGAKAGIAFGTFVGGFFAGIGAVPGAVIGGIVGGAIGSIAGGYYGGEYGEDFGNYLFK